MTQKSEKSEKTFRLIKMNSKQRKKQDYEDVKNRVYSDKGCGPNPYPKNTRKNRMWAKEVLQYQRMESFADEMALVYGEFRPDRISEE